MRCFTHLFVPLALACALVGCAPTAAPAPSPPPSATTPAPGAAAPTAAPAQPSAPTLAPATQTPAPGAAAPTATPGAAAPTLAPATQTPAPGAAAPTAAPGAAAPTAGPGASIGAEILFLSGGKLVALDLAGGAERTLADGVSAFAATPDGSALALARGEGADTEIWLVGRAGADLRRLTANDRAESSLSWAPDGQSLAYTAAPDLAPRPPDWQSWAGWCAAAEARVIDLAGGAERTLGDGCEPAFSPDGRRIAFTTPPTAASPGTDFPGATNTITIVNRQGEHGWSVAMADQAGGAEGYLVYGPAWAPDGDRVAYQRFLGYQALVDINLTEASSSFKRAGEPIGFGAGWLLAPSYAPDGAHVAVVERNFSDARGFSGYDIWGLTVLRLGEEQELALPSATMMLQAATAASLPRATAAAWSPDGAALAVTLPAGWKPGLTDQEPVFSAEGPGELWRWRPGAPPESRLAEGVDFASPLLWLPPPPTVAQREARVALAVPQGWALRQGPPDYLAAEGPAGHVIAARLVAGAPPGEPEGLFPELLASGVGLDDPVFLPDGSMLRGATGSAPDGSRRAGMLRISADGSTAALYLAAPADWPRERAYALALLAASGR